MKLACSYVGRNGNGYGMQNKIIAEMSGKFPHVMRVSLKFLI